jgi:hypothetical protein
MQGTSNKASMNGETESGASAAKNNGGVEQEDGEADQS